MVKKDIIIELENLEGYIKESKKDLAIESIQNLKKELLKKSNSSEEYMEKLINDLN